MDEVIGFTDNLKLLSFITLFEVLSNSSSIFTKNIETYFDDEQDEASLKIILFR